MSQPTHDIESLPEWSQQWAATRLAQHERDCNQVSSDEWTGLRDWLVSLPTHRPRMVGKLYKLTLEQALLAQSRWHAEMAERTARIAAELGSFGGDPVAFKPVLVAQGLKDWQWVHVTSPLGLDYEGAAMGHCVGGGNYDEGCSIYSLRDPHNMPHCTIEWHPDTRSVRQVQGRANAVVVERYQGSVIEFINSLHPLKVEGVGKFGHVLVGGRLVHWSTLLPGSHVEGNLELEDCLGLIYLPDNLHVDGSLVIARCDNLERLGQGLSVGRNLYIGVCDKLAGLPPDLDVAGNITINRCGSITDLPDSIEYRSKLRVLHCQNITRLPSLPNVEYLELQGLHALTVLPHGLVLQALSLSGCDAIACLPDDIKVDKYLDLAGCTALTHLPGGLHIQNWMDMYKCSALHALPPDLWVGGWLSLVECKSLQTLPDNLRVGDSLNMQGCTGLVSIPPDLRVDGCLDLAGCTSLQPLPSQLDVGERIHLPWHLRQQQAVPQVSPR